MCGLLSFFLVVLCSTDASRAALLALPLPQGARLWCGMGDGAVLVVDPVRGRREHTLHLHRQIVTCVAAVGATVWTGALQIATRSRLS